MSSFPADTRLRVVDVARIAVGVLFGLGALALALTGEVFGAIVGSGYGLVVAVENRFAKEGKKTALGLMGTGQLSLTKAIVLVDGDVNPRDRRAVFTARPPQTNSTRTPCFTFSVLRMSNVPICPVARTCVPPQAQRSKPLMPTRRSSLLSARWRPVSARMDSPPPCR